MRISSRTSWSSRIRLIDFFTVTCPFALSNRRRFDNDLLQGNAFLGVLLL
jgi:hypothetical protein